MMVLDQLIESVEELKGSKSSFEIVGNGLSFALASSLASALRARGYVAFCGLPDNQNYVDRTGCVLVSGSARQPLKPVHILITNDNNSPAWFDGTKSSLIKVKDEMPEAWFPLDFARVILGTDWVPSTAAIHLAKKCEINLLFDTCGPDARKYILAASDKIGKIPLRALSIGEFGHGFHSRLINTEIPQLVIFCFPSSSPSKKRNDVRNWIADYTHSIHVDQLDLPGTAYSAEYALSVGVTTVAFIKLLCTQLDVDLHHCPIPQSIDTLR